MEICKKPNNSDKMMKEVRPNGRGVCAFFFFVYLCRLTLSI